LDENDVAAALDLYRQALARVNPAPADLLTQVSGDLGNRGRPPRSSSSAPRGSTSSCTA
jgi:hypothetical protein